MSYSEPRALEVRASVVAMRRAALPFLQMQEERKKDLKWRKVL